MKHFDGLTAFSEHILKTAIAEGVAQRAALGKCAKLVEKEAKAEIGTYQTEAGPFMAWAELAESTLYGGYANGIRYPGKIELGYATDDEHNPLLRTGGMRDSIQHVLSVDGLEAQIGSNDDKALWQELGTEHIPPRSFLGGAMARKVPEINEILGEAIFAALIGEEVVNRMLVIEG